MHKLSRLALIPVALVTLTSCIYQADTRSLQTSQEEASIWSRSSRYGYGSQDIPFAERYTPYVQTQDPSATSPYQTYTGINSNRYGQNQPRYDRQFQPGERRLSGSVSRSETLEERQRMMISESSRVDSPSSDQPGNYKPFRTRDESQDMLASAGSKRDSSGTSSSTPSSKSPSSSAGATQFDHLPFAVPVPGKVGYVTLPAPNSGMPEIDVRGIASGTPVEIPDPRGGGKTIQFRVP